MSDLAPTLSTPLTNELLRARCLAAPDLDSLSPAPEADQTRDNIERTARATKRTKAPTTLFTDRILYTKHRLHRPDDVAASLAVNGTTLATRLGRRFDGELWIPTPS